jgi:hypothetical protein
MGLHTEMGFLRAAARYKMTDDKRGEDSEEKWE